MLREPVPAICRWSPPSRPASTGRSPRPTSAMPSPTHWATELGVRRWGFHGASHRYIAGRMPELLGPYRHQGDLLPPGRQLVALRDPQRQVGRVQPGDEPAVRAAAQQPRGRFRRLRPAGPAPRDRQEPRRDPRHPGQPVGAGGHERRGLRPPRHRGRRRRPATRGRKLAIDVFIASIRHYLGAYLLELDGADAIVFTGGIGENSTRDPVRGLPRPRLVRHRARPGARTPRGRPSARVSTAGSRVQVWTVPTNEEIVVARQAKELLDSIQ